MNTKTSVKVSSNFHTVKQEDEKGTIVGGVDVEDGEDVGGLVDGRRDRHEVLLTETRVRDGVSSDCNRHNYAGELSRRNEDSHQRH